MFPSFCDRVISTVKTKGMTRLTKKNIQAIHYRHFLQTAMVLTAPQPYEMQKRM